MRIITRSLLVLGASTALLVSGAPAQAADPGHPYDFDGRGHPSLVVGAPSLQVGKVDGAGGVVVLPPAAGGAVSRAKFLSQSTKHVPGASERGDAFGAAMVSADFDGDGYADLAVGQPQESVGKHFQSGAVTVLYGSRHGLSGRRSIQLVQTGHSHGSAAFGSALAAGDVTRDGYPDLVVGAPGDDGVVGSRQTPASGSVTVFPGGTRGLSTDRARRLLGQRGTTGYDQGFGAALAIGDVDHDGRGDLVVVSTGDGSPDAQNYAGSVAYCHSADGGPTSCRRLAHDDALAGATSLVLAHLSGSASPEIAVGVPQNDDDTNPGSVQILTLAGAPVPAVAQQSSLTQRSAGVPGASAKMSDGFGQSLSAGDVDGDGFDDLVVGAPDEQVSGHPSAGRVVVVHGAPSGWRTTRNESIDEGSPGVPRSSTSYDFFGTAVDLTGHDGHLDLVIGAPGKTKGSGTLTLLPGTADGFDTTRSRVYRLSTLGYPKPAKASFGNAVGQ